MIDLSERAASRFFDTPFDELTVPERVFVAVWTLEADVNDLLSAYVLANRSGIHGAA